MTDPQATCAYCRCKRTAHDAGKGRCWTRGCECRLFTDLAAVRDSIARHPAGKGIA